MKKKIYLSILMISLVGGLGYAATQAFFSARQTATGSNFTVGTLDLSVDGKQSAIDPFIVEGIGESGDISGGKEWTVKNIGTLPGRLFFSLSNLNNQENGCNQPEIGDEPECTLDENGELGNVITASVKVDGTEYVSSNLATVNQSVFGETWESKPNIIIAPNSQVVVRMEWSTPQEAYNNSIQSDSLSFDTNFVLEQLINR